MLETASFTPFAVCPADLNTQNTPELMLLFTKERILTQTNTQDLELQILISEPDSKEIYKGEKHFLGLWNGQKVFCAQIHDDFEPDTPFRLLSRRELYGTVSDELFTLAGFAFQVLYWHIHNRFCGLCGQKTKKHEAQRALVCTKCSHTVWPRVNPAIIVLIYNEKDELLLIRSPHFPGNRFSTVAGFVEQGESLEETVHREIMEETGVTVKNIRYFKSQPWPWPSNIMIGFFAEYESGEAVPDGVEISEAKWFHKDSLPEFPGPLSLGRQLIDCWLTGTMSG